MVLERDSRERASARRAQILEAAYGVFASKGYAAATIADVAQALSLGHGTIYRYFDNKLDLFMAVVSVILERIVTAVAMECTSYSATLDEYRAQVERIGRRLIGLLETDPAIAKVLFYEAMGVSDELDERIHVAWEAAGQVTASFLENGRTRGFLRADLDSEATALAIHALMFEAGRRIVRDKDRVAARDRWLAAIISLIFDGVRSP